MHFAIAPVPGFSSRIRARLAPHHHHHTTTNEHQHATSSNAMQRNSIPLNSIRCHYKLHPLAPAARGPVVHARRAPRGSVPQRGHDPLPAGTQGDRGLGGEQQPAREARRRQCSAHSRCRCCEHCPRRRRCRCHCTCEHEQGPAIQDPTAHGDRRSDPERVGARSCRAPAGLVADCQSLDSERVVVVQVQVTATHTTYREMWDVSQRTCTLNYRRRYVRGGKVV